MKALNENIFHQYNKWKTGYTRKENSLKIRLRNFIDKYKFKSELFEIEETSEKTFVVNVGYDSETEIRIHDDDLINGEIPFKFGTVPDFFSVSNCTLLTTLKNSPNGFSSVVADFNCKECPSLISLEGAPRKVYGFFCYKCKNLPSLVGAPERVDDIFKCSDCPNLTSLEGAPKYIDTFRCDNCASLTSLIGLSKSEIVESFSCTGCNKLTSLEGLPKRISGTLHCEKCPNLTSLEGLPKYIGESLYIDKKFYGLIPKDVHVENDIKYV